MRPVLVPESLVSTSPGTGIGTTYRRYADSNTNLRAQATTTPVASQCVHFETAVDPLKRVPKHDNMSLNLSVDAL